MRSSASNVGASNLKDSVASFVAFPASSIDNRRLEMFMRLPFYASQYPITAPTQADAICLMPSSNLLPNTQFGAVKTRKPKQSNARLITIRIIATSFVMRRDGLGILAAKSCYSFVDFITEKRIQFVKRNFPE